MPELKENTLEIENEFFTKRISKILNIITIIIQLTIVILLVISTGILFYKIFLTFVHLSEFNPKELIENIFFIFLILELIVAIKIYFKENFHFPIRFFVYLGITDLIRQLIININDWKLVLTYSISTLILFYCLTLMRRDQEHIEIKKI